MNKNNQIIADFMCNQYTNHVGKSDRYKWQLVKDGIWYEESDLQYDKSWDWLMPVVEKIEHTSMYVVIKGCLVTMSDIIDISASTKIEATWLAVIEFIKWYNRNKL